MTIGALVTSLMTPRCAESGRSGGSKMEWKYFLKKATVQVHTSGTFGSFSLAWHQPSPQNKCPSFTGRQGKGVEFHRLYSALLVANHPSPPKTIPGCFGVPHEVLELGAKGCLRICYEPQPLHIASRGNGRARSLVRCLVAHRGETVTGRRASQC